MNPVRKLDYLEEIFLSDFAMYFYPVKRAELFYNGVKEVKKVASCALCGKERVTGNNVSHANNKTKKWIMPNLQRMRIITKNGAKRQYVCTGCLRSGRVKKVVE